MKNIFSEKEAKRAEAMAKSPEPVSTNNKQRGSKEASMLLGLQRSQAQKEGVSFNADAPNPLIIQQWHVVLGDTHARADRTTIATKLLREIKETFKKTHKGGKKTIWIPLAIEDFRKRLPQQFPDIPTEDFLVLVKCTARAIEAKTDRILVPNQYKYEDDEAPTYGIARWEESLEFFLASRDAPTLASELERYKKEFNKLQKSKNRPPTNMLKGFMKTLLFFEEKLAEAEQCTLSMKLLESLKPINALKEQFKMLEANKQTAPADESGDRVNWDDLSLTVVERPKEHQKPKAGPVGIPTYRKHNQRPGADGARGYHKRIRTTGKTSPVTSSLHPSPLEHQSALTLRESVASSGDRFRLSYTHHAQERQNTYRRGARFQPFAPMEYAPLSDGRAQPTAGVATNTPHFNSSVTDSTQETNELDDLMRDDILDFEDDLVDSSDGFPLETVLPHEWEWSEIPPPSMSTRGSSHTASTNPVDASMLEWMFSGYPEDFSSEQDEDMAEFVPPISNDSSKREEQQKPKGAFAPGWILVKIAALASIFGLHTFRTPTQVLRPVEADSVRPADLPDPPSISDAPCPVDDACTYIMEAIFPAFPSSTFPLVGVPGTCQNWAREWLGSNADIMEFSVERVRQRFALAVFYCETDGASWDENDLWVSELHECDWNTMAGIDPCNRQEEYQILRYSGQQMRGTLPPELSMVSSLWEISLSDNFLTGTIPSDFSKLSELDTFSVAYNLFRGKIPEFLWTFEDLIHLDLGYNLFSGTIPDTLHLTEPNLRDLFLSYNQFSGTIPSTFGQMDWQRLHLDGNQLHGTIPEDINAGKLRELLLHNNQLSGNFPAESFSTEWSGRHSKLEAVTLYQNNLEGDVNAMCRLITDPSIGKLETFVVDLEKMACDCCSGPP
eukprot:scaffold24206_cov250-Amphora_coffeaeformis.AAC.2